MASIIVGPSLATEIYTIQREQRSRTEWSERDDQQFLSIYSLYDILKVLMTIYMPLYFTFVSDELVNPSEYLIMPLETVRKHQS